MLWYLPSLLLQGITRIITLTSQSLLIISFLLSAAYSLGWIHRLIWFTAEREISKLLNGTPVTIGNLRVDLIRGKVWASNVVLHSPRRREWKWESPVLARIGSVYVETNLVHCILSDLFLWEELPLELHTVIVSDIQGFVERKQNIFNFYLIDPHWILPDPQDIVGQDANTSFSRDEYVTEGGAVVGGGGVRTDTTMNPSSWEISAEESSHVTDADYETSEKAQTLLDDMVRAVHSLGMAAQEGSLQGALVEHRQTITTKLRALQTSKKTEAMKEGVKIAQEVGKVVVEKTQNAQQAAVPPRREIEGEKPVQSRIGRIVVRDVRIFTRDHWDNTMVADDDNDDITNNNGASSKGSSGKSSWNKPISLKQVVMRPSDLCPPTSAKDKDGYPALYQPIDRYLDVVWKRLLAEVAKTDTGHLFNTAVSEVLGIYSMEKETLPADNSY